MQLTTKRVLKPLLILLSLLFLSGAFAQDSDSRYDDESLDDESIDRGDMQKMMKNLEAQNKALSKLQEKIEKGESISVKDAAKVLGQLQNSVDALEQESNPGKKIKPSAPIFPTGDALEKMSLKKGQASAFLMRAIAPYRSMSERKLVFKLKESLSETLPMKLMGNPNKAYIFMARWIKDKDAPIKFIELADNRKPALYFFGCIVLLFFLKIYLKRRSKDKDASFGQNFKSWLMRFTALSALKLAAFIVFLGPFFAPTGRVFMSIF